MHVLGEATRFALLIAMSWVSVVACSLLRPISAHACLGGGEMIGLKEGEEQERL